MLYNTVTGEHAVGVVPRDSATLMNGISQTFFVEGSQGIEILTKVAITGWQETAGSADLKWVGTWYSASGDVLHVDQMVNIASGVEEYTWVLNTPPSAVTFSLEMGALNPSPNWDKDQNVVVYQDIGIHLILDLLVEACMRADETCKEANSSPLGTPTITCPTDSFPECLCTKTSGCFAINVCSCTSGVPQCPVELMYQTWTGY